MKLVVLFLVISFVLVNAEAGVRQKRDNHLSTRWISRKGGIDIPITLRFLLLIIGCFRSLITCMIPGLNDLICLGPRVGLFEPRQLVTSPRDGPAFGYNNGVDLRMLGPFNVPLIGDQTEIGVHYGATVAKESTPTAGAVEFGKQNRIFKTWNWNRGGEVEWSPQGVGVDVGSRMGIADDLIRLQKTIFGVTVGEPNQGVAPLAPKTNYRIPGLAFEQYYHGYPMLSPSDQYRRYFYRPGDEYRTKQERACPWCFAVQDQYVAK